MISAGWTEQYEEQRNDRKLLAELGRKAKRGDLQAEEALDYAHLTEQFEGLEKANPLYTAALKQILIMGRPTSIWVEFCWSRIMRQAFLT